VAGDEVGVDGDEVGVDGDEVSEDMMGAACGWVVVTNPTKNTKTQLAVPYQTIFCWSSIS
jgi:hypothetical protein